MVEFISSEKPSPVTLSHRIFGVARSGDIQAIRSFCDSEGIAINTVFDNGETLLFPAASSQRLEMCEWLIENRVSASHQNRSGRTALLSAIWNRDANWKNKLIEILACTVNIADNAGITPLMRSTQGAGGFGAKRGSLQIVKSLLTHGADVFAQDNCDRTALGHAMAAAKASKADVNDEIIFVLEDAMVNAAAKVEFYRLYKHHFSANGVLMLQNRI